MLVVLGHISCIAVGSVLFGSSEFPVRGTSHFDAFLRAEREKMTMTECPNTEMQSFPQQVIVGILVPAGQMGQVGQVGQMGQVAQVGQVAHFPSYQAVAAPAIYAKPEYMYMPQQMAPMVPQMCPHVGDGNSSFPVTPRSPARQASPEERLQKFC